jgi:DNA polymerase-3 subunit delta'
MFEEFLGNDELKNEISARILNGNLPHALVFYGEEGTGCGFFARLVAREYLEDKNDLVMRNVHPDYVLIQGSGSSGQVAVSDVREALYEMNKAAVMTDGRRVIHISQAENLNSYSSNALLKMMEEPPEGVIFILTVRRLDDLIPTIRSRAVCYRIKPLDTDICAREAVLRYNIERDRAESLAELFGGRLGMVIRASTDQYYSASVIIAERFLKSALSKNRYLMMESLAQAENRDQLSTVLKIVLSGVSSLIKKTPEETSFAGKVFELTSDALEQNEAYVNARTVTAVLAEKISKAS